MQDIKNRTLGFSKVIVIGMPVRSDKKDAITLAASYTDIDFEWEDGVVGADIPDIAIPYSWDQKQSKATLGCWRAHINVAQRVVRERLQSVWIMEDDGNWDVHLKGQLVDVARGARFLQGLTDISEDNLPSQSPYGDDWDLLWAGHCGIQNNKTEENARYWVTRDDPTAIPVSLWHHGIPNLDAPVLQGSNFSRYVFEAAQGRCMTSYALSFRGARRLLQHQAFEHASPIDRGIGGFCGTRYAGTRCIGVFPALVYPHRAFGPTAKDSDRHNTAGTFRNNSATEGLVFPTKVNLAKLAEEKKGTMVSSQYPDDTMWREIDAAAELPSRGQGVVVNPEDFNL